MHICKMETVQADLRFHCPCGIHIVGPTMSGKSTLTRKILSHTVDLFDKAFDRVVYAYSVLQSDFEFIQGNVEFIQGINNILEDDAFFQPGDHTLLILDDLMDEISSNRKAAALFTRGIHHKNVTVIFLYQNLFKQGNAMRDITLNTQYIILFKSLRDVQQIKYLGRQLGLPHLECAYRKAIKEPFGFLLINIHPQVHEKLQLQSHIFSERRAYCKR
jgi:hypothetical protein